MTKGEMTKDEKRARVAATTDHNLHVLLVMRQDEASLSDARVTAWLEGREGLKTRLGPK